MNFKRISSPTHPLYAEAVNLYKISFPLHEQREKTSQTEILTNPFYHFDVVCEHDKFIGEILYWDIERFCYIEHFCVLPSGREG